LLFQFLRLHCQPLGDACGAIREYPIAPYAGYTGSKKKYADILEARIGEAVNRIGTLNVHAMAWCFPKEVRTLEGLHSNLLPGVIMIARNASIA
jgi:hypothetical protein